MESHRVCFSVQLECLLAGFLQVTDTGAYRVVTREWGFQALGNFLLFDFLCL